MLITDNEIQTLKACSSESEWNTACDAIKRARDGEYPADWFPKIIMSGLMGRVSASF